jgi:hypothetical protein
MYDLMIAIWNRAAAMTLVLCVAALTLGAPSEATTKTPRGSIYLMRGLANVFSLGLDTLNDKLHARGVDSHVLNYASWMSIAGQIEKRYKADKNALPVVLMGHSFGADSTLLLAAELGKAKIPVALIVNFDAVNNIKVPANVRHVVNFYESTGNGLALSGGPGFRGQLENIDVSKVDNTIGHLNIEKSPRLHTWAISEVLRVLGR